MLYSHLLDYVTVTTAIVTILLITLKVRITIEGLMGM